MLFLNEIENFTVIIFPLYQDLGLAVRFIGLGEDLDDLITFDALEYTQGLLGTK